MTKKDFEALAEIIRNEMMCVREANDEDQSPSEIAENVLAEVAHRLAIYCKTQNPRFDTERFLSACEVK